VGFCAEQTIYIYLSRLYKTALQIYIRLQQLFGSSRNSDSYPLDTDHCFSEGKLAGT
jgi:hypothetical protein